MDHEFQYLKFKSLKDDQPYEISVDCMWHMWPKIKHLKTNRDLLSLKISMRLQNSKSLFLSVGHSETLFGKFSIRQLTNRKNVHLAKISFGNWRKARNYLATESFSNSTIRQFFKWQICHLENWQLANGHSAIVN